MSFLTEALVESNNGLSPGVAGVWAASSRGSSFAAVAAFAIGVFNPCSIRFVVVVLLTAGAFIGGVLGAVAFKAEALGAAAALAAGLPAAGFGAGFALAFAVGLAVVLADFADAPLAAEALAACALAGGVLPDL